MEVRKNGRKKEKKTDENKKDGRKEILYIYKNLNLPFCLRGNVYLLYDIYDDFS